MVDSNWVLVFLTIAGMVVGFIVWLVRLEGKIKNAEKRLDLVEDHMANFDSKIAAELREMNTRLAHIEGFLKKPMVDL